MAEPKDFQPLFEQLKTILQSYEGYLLVKGNGPEGYSLDTPYVARFEKELFFGAVKIGKNYVSYHLMPVYIFPDLLTHLSPALKKRMRGKSCFNFTRLPDEQYQELIDLTRLSFDRFKETGILA